jgi:enolase
MTQPRLLVLESVSAGPTINSQAQLTDEYCLHFATGLSGRGSAPRGETLSRYESRAHSARSRQVIGRLAADRIIGKELSQQQFDQYLESRAEQFGPGAMFALSSAFFEATVRQTDRQPHRPAVERKPRFCLNILNGGPHAYTNPVLSDFHEFLLMPKDGDIEQLLEDHYAIQSGVTERLASTKTACVSGNMVHVLGNNGNRDAIELLLNVLDELGLAGRYKLMVDAAASDLWDGSAYALTIAEQREFSPPEFEDYWLRLLGDYPLAILEDPFAEHDLNHWHSLAAKDIDCRLFGDDVHCGDAKRIKRLLADECMAGLVLKPDQAGTISRTLEAIGVARAVSAPIVLSHRSISTDSLVLAHLMGHCNLELAKFGPLLTDFTSILRMNEVLRMSGSNSNDRDAP